MEWLIALLLFLAVMYKYRKQAEVHFPLVMFRARKLVDAVWKIGRRHSRAFSIVSDLAVLLSLIAMPFVFYLIGKSAFDIMTIKELGSQIVPIVPGVKFPGSEIYIPLWSGIIAMAVLGSVHELAHGLVASAQGTKPKSIVLIFLAFFTSFGVELDEREMQAIDLRKKLRIFAAGSFANFLSAIAFALAMFAIAALVAPLVVPEGMRVITIEPGSPAEGLLSVGDMILEMNGTSTKDIVAFANYTSSFAPNETLTVVTDKGTFTLPANYETGNSTVGKIGVVSTPEFVLWKKLLLYPSFWLLQLLNLIVSFNVSVAFLNLMPLPPFDGGRIVMSISEKYLPKSKLPNFIYAVTFSLLMVNMFGGLVKGLF